MVDLCQACRKNLMHYMEREVIDGKTYCGPSTSECVYVGVRTKSWKFTEADAQELLAHLFDEEAS